MSAEALQWESVPCPLCHCREDRDFYRAPGDDGLEYRLGRCTACDLVYTNPRPTAASIGRFYPEDYSPYQPPRRRRTGFLRSLRERLGLRREKTPFDRVPRSAGATLLDCGCGSGWFAAQMRDRGWNAVGMDFSAHAVAAARQNFGLQVHHGSLPHPAVAPGSVDAITLRAVLEHVHDPRALLAAAYDALKPGGWLYASVPNLSSWGFRAFGPAWFPLDPPRHLLHFTPETLRRAVEACGFEVNALTTLGHTKWMGYSVDRALRGRPRWWVHASRSHLVRSAIVRWTRWTRQGDDLACLVRKPLSASTARRIAA